MTSREEIKEKLVNLLIENSLFPDSEIASIMDEDLINAGLIDSMAFIKLRVLLEEDFNVFIPEEKLIQDIRTINQMIDYIAAEQK